MIQEHLTMEMIEITIGMDIQRVHVVLITEITGLTMRPTGIVVCTTITSSEIFFILFF